MGNTNGRESITVIVPLYKGNSYVEKLIKNVTDVCEKSDADITEIIFVNDSPWEEIDLPVLDENFPITVTTLNNEQNCGIQKSRVKGLSACNTSLFIFLDQDDELIPEGFDEQMKMIRNADIVVGNGFYQYGERFEPIYKNKKVMEYLIQKKRFIEIRNLIPSPGCCLLRRDSIPQKWKESCLEVNGADDWYLWLLMFSEGRRFAVNNCMVYQHNTTEAGNLSMDLDKMYQSAMEMHKRLEQNCSLSNKELDLLKDAIEFKYLQDTKKITVKNLIEFIHIIFANIRYKMHFLHIF